MVILFGNLETVLSFALLNSVGEGCEYWFCGSFAVQSDCRVQSSVLCMLDIKTLRTKTYVDCICMHFSMLGFGFRFLEVTGF